MGYLILIWPIFAICWVYFETVESQGSRLVSLRSLLVKMRAHSHSNRSGLGTPMKLAKLMSQRSQRALYEGTDSVIHLYGQGSLVKHYNSMEA